jgi:hypothetical protein
VTYGVLTLFWVVINREEGVPAWYAPLHPLGAAVLFVTFAGAAWRGSRVSWKGRAYQSVPARESVAGTAPHHTGRSE